MIYYIGIRETDMTTNRSKSEAYLKSAQPTGGALTPEQSETYQKLLIEEGHPVSTSAGILKNLEELQKKSKNANDSRTAPPQPF